MELRAITISDITEINTWFHERKSENLPIKFLSPVGIIVPSVAAGFLVQTDAGYGILEPFISNPKASKEDRDKALTAILDGLVNTARKLGLTSVFGFSTNQPMLERAMKQDFIICEQNSTTVYKGLE